MSEQWSLVESADTLIVRGPGVTSPAEGAEAQWESLPLSAERLLICRRQGQKAMGGSDSGLGRSSVELYLDLLLGCTQRQFTGMVAVDTGFGVKKIYFQEGRLCFAGSNMIDDRLGEVIYREGRITLDQMADSAVAVNRNTKFGRVLLDSKIFTVVDLWEALQLQIFEIVRSTFLVDKLYFQVQPGSNLAPTAVEFNQSSHDLLTNLAAYGSMFRAFMGRLTPSTKLQVTTPQPSSQTPAIGTFNGDMLAMVQATPTVLGVLETCKLSRLNTYLSLFRLTNQQLIQPEESQELTFMSFQGIGELRTLLDTYGMLVTIATKAFAAERLTLPVGEIAAFLERTDKAGTQYFRLNSFGHVDQQSVRNVHALSGYNSVLAKTASLIRSLSQFLLQTSVDLLPRQRGQEVKQQYTELVA